MQYRKLMIDATTTRYELEDKVQPGIDPWKEVTVASVCSQVFRSKFLEEKWNVEHKRFESSPFALIPRGGYTTNINYSKISIVWLEWLVELKRREGINDYHIQHALNGTEKKIEYRNTNGKHSFYHVDGFHKDGRSFGTVLEFLGCMIHGHKCLNHARDKPLFPNSKQTPHQLYQASLLRQKTLKVLDTVSV